MKLNFTRALIALAVVSLTYTACQKSGSNPSTTASTTTKTAATVNYDALAVSMATSFYKGITGSNGGTNVNNGMQAASIVVKKASNKFQLDAISSLCGYFVDTSYFTTSNVNDTTKFMSTKFKFLYRCLNGGKVNSYSCYDSVFTQDYNSAFVNTSLSIQDYNVVASDTTFTKFLCDGRIIGNFSTLVNPTASAIQVYHALKCDYKIYAVAVKVTNTVPDIVAGYCTYVSSTNDIDPATGASGVVINYTGNIVFLGNHLAKLTIDPQHVYTINFVTGTITARG